MLRYSGTPSNLITGSIIQALPFDWRGAAGGNYAAVIFDELHAWTLEQHQAHV